jgi:hypothetical protein
VLKSTARQVIPASATDTGQRSLRAQATWLAPFSGGKFAHPTEGFAKCLARS